MMDNNDPDKKIEGAESTEDQEIVELEDETVDASQDDEGIIDLLEAVDGPGLEDIKGDIVAEETESTEDQEIIELDDEGIIDLLEDVDEPALEDEKEDVFAEKAESASEEIITLTEAMSDTPQEIEEIGEPIHITVDTSQEDESVIDLEGNLLEETSDFDDEMGEKVAFDQDISDDFVDSLGLELDSKEDVSENLLDAEKVSDAQMEAALERVIKKMFYEKIDSILVEVTEKTVTRELEKLKSILLQDAAENEK